MNIIFPILIPIIGDHIYQRNDKDTNKILYSLSPELEEYIFNNHIFVEYLIFKISSASLNFKEIYYPLWDYTDDSILYIKTKTYSSYNLLITDEIDAFKLRLFL